MRYLKTILLCACLNTFAVYDVFSQSITSITYDANGNRIAKAIRGSSPHPAVAANPTTVNIGQSTVLTASGCTGGTIQWQTGQATSSFSTNVYESITFVATCTKPNCPINGQGQAAVSVVIPPCAALGAISLSVQAGNWSSGTTWYCGKIPAITDDVYLRHAVNVDVNGSAKGIVLGGGYLNFTNNSFLTVPQN